MGKCKNCGFENPDKSRYCQRCGEKLKRSIWTEGKNPIPLYGMGHKGPSLAPLAGMAVDNYAKEMEGQRKESFPKIPVTANQQGEWYCPLCGDRNETKICKGCGFSI